MTADTVGGVWTYALELARALGHWRIEVVLATMGAPLTPEQRRETRRIPNLWVFESAFKLEWMEDPWADLTDAGEWLLRLEGQVRPDIVHLNSYIHGALPWTAATVMVGHSCVLSWWKAVRGEDAPPQWNRYRTEVARGLAAADVVVSPTRAMLDALQKHYGEIPRTAVIPNGRDPALFRPDMKDDIVLAAGRLWDEAKNIGMLERVAPRLRWPVFVAGQNKHPDGGRRRFKHVRCLGRISPEVLAGWYGRAGIYALPARYEPFGLSILEAAMSGCALVLGDIPSLRETWDGAAIFVPPCDERALAHAINELADDPLLRATLRTHARDRAARLTSKSMAAAYASLYYSVTAATRRALAS